MVCLPFGGVFPYTEALQMLSALSPLDGRYASSIEALRPFFSEHALIKARVEVEVRYFIALSEERSFKGLSRVKGSQQKALLKLVENFNEREAEKVKQIEKRTNHDVKAVEYYLKEKIARISGLKRSVEFIHFGLTSEDVNNLAYGLMVHGALKNVIRPAFTETQKDVQRLARKWMKIKLLSLTHGQPATPTTVGREFQVFADRLQRQLDQLKAFRMQGKFGGAVGNYASISIAAPDVKWAVFGKSFVRSLGLTPLPNATQINPHDDIAELSHIVERMNTILIDLSRDMWLYISRGVFKQKVIAGHVGSSTMPHKVNPIDFENAEGNLGVSNALFKHFAEKLPISRLQRDLTDSTVQRNIGSAFGYTLLSLKSLARGLNKLEINKPGIRSELEDHAEVLAEPIQLILRRKGVDGAYEKLKAATRGTTVNLEDLITFMKREQFSKDEIKRVISLLK